MLKLFNREPKPVAEGYLPEEDGHKIYWARYGNVNGETIINFHGGPGDKSKFKHIKMIDLKKFNIIVFDQRGCGKSEPKGKLEDNNTDKTLSDAKRILDMLNVKTVIVKGGSWGSTLALLFSERYSKMVSKIIVSAILLGTSDNYEWIFSPKYIAQCYPDLSEKLMKNVPKGESIIGTYFNLINSNKKSDVKKAMEGFSNYEMSLGKINVSADDKANWGSLDENKIYLYFVMNKWFIKENEILKNIKTIANKPCLIIHNRLDVLCPLKSAWDLHKSMKKSQLIIKSKLGHARHYDKKTIKQIAEFLEDKK